MILQIFSRAFFSSNRSKAANVQNHTQPHSIDIPGVPDKKRVFLNSASISDIKEKDVVVLGSSGVKREAAAMTQQLKNGNTMVTNSDGSYIVRNAEGRIIKTCDVVMTKREYDYDENGALLVRRFGLWTAPEEARLDEQGTLFFKKDDLLIEERLSGLHIQKNTVSGITIQTHHHSNFELIKLANGEIWKRETTNDTETFVIWKHGKLSFKSETFFTSRRAITNTPNGPESLPHVSRLEQSWAGGSLTREKLSFKNGMSGERFISISLQLATGKLGLRNVVSIISTFEDGLPKDTTFELKDPVTFKLDIPSMKGSLDNIIKVRNFRAGLNLGLCFVTKEGDEYVVFVGARGVENRAKAAAAASEIDMAMAEGAQFADLVLR